MHSVLNVIWKLCVALSLQTKWHTWARSFVLLFIRPSVTEAAVEAEKKEKKWRRPDPLCPRRTETTTSQRTAKVHVFYPPPTVAWNKYTYADRRGRAHTKTRRHMQTYTTQFVLDLLINTCAPTSYLFTLLFCFSNTSITDFCSKYSMRHTWPYTFLSGVVQKCNSERLNTFQLLHTLAIVIITLLHTLKL